MDPEVKAMLLKAISAKLCPTISGQAAMDVAVNPPRPGEPSYDLFIKVRKFTVMVSSSNFQRNMVHCILVYQMLFSQAGKSPILSLNIIYHISLMHCVFSHGVMRSAASSYMQRCIWSHSCPVLVIV